MKRLLLLLVCMGFVSGCSNATPTVAPTETPVPPTQTPVIVVEVREAPVTQIVEVTRQVEVTRIVERVITVTPEPTPLPTLTPTLGPTRTPAPPAAQTQLLNSLIALRKEVEAIAFDSGRVSCGRTSDTSLPNHYESIINYPTYAVASAAPAVQRAHADYRQAIAIITSSNRDMYTLCLDWVAKGSPQEYVASLTWMTARQGVDQALGLVVPAIELLESE